MLEQSILVIGKILLNTEKIWMAFRCILTTQIKNAKY